MFIIVSEELYLEGYVIEFICRMRGYSYYLFNYIVDYFGLCWGCCVI